MGKGGADIGSDRAQPFGTSSQRLILALIPLGVIVIFCLLKANFSALYWALGLEDGLIENLQALICLLSALIAAVVANDLRQKKALLLSGLFVLLAAGFMFVFLEEVRWGQ